MTLVHYLLFIGYVCVCVWRKGGGGVLRPLLLYRRGGRTQDWSFACKTDWADFTTSMSFLPSNLMAEMIPNREALNANTKSLLSALKGWEDNDLGINVLI